MHDDAAKESDRAREIEKIQMLYLTRRLTLRPDEIQQLSAKELDCRLRLLQQAEQAEELHRAKFKRWQNICELRWLMYEVQREFNKEHGEAAIGVSIWRILALEQDNLEAELQLDDLLGDCQRFPSPMSLMVPECEPDRVLKPLRSVLTGVSSKRVEKPERTPFTDALYEQERQLQEERTTNEDHDLQRSSSELSTMESSCDMQEDLLDLQLELQDIQRSTARCDWIMEALFASHDELSDDAINSRYPSNELCVVETISDF